MKGLERITNLRLAEVLTQNGLLTREEMGEAISLHESSGERFVSVLVNTGFVTEWDLAKVVAEPIKNRSEDFPIYPHDPAAIPCPRRLR